MPNINYIVRRLKTFLNPFEFIKVFRSILHLNAYKLLTELKADPKYNDPKCLIRYGNRVYSQNDEDGIIQEIFKRIGTKHKNFLEFGVGNGLENNTLALLFDNWSGVWIEGSSAMCDKINKGFSKTISSGQLKIVNAMLTCENINQVIGNCFEENKREIDLLSVDVDGNDYHLIEAITVINPRVIIAEYNSKFAPPLEYCMSYNPTHAWLGNDTYGASLKFYETHLNKKGYSLVGTNIAGFNAFFVRNDLIEKKFYEPFTAENHYESFKRTVVPLSGHKPTYETLESRLIQG